MTSTIPLPPTLLPPTPVLETARLILRPLAATDVPAIQRIFPQWEVVRHLRASIPWPCPPEAIAASVADNLEKLARGEKQGWAITLRGDDGLRGFIELEPDDGVSQDMRGFWLDPKLHGRGLMTEAADAVTDHAFETLGWPHLYLNNAVGNEASARIKRRQGAVELRREPMDYISGRQDRVIWILTRDAWRARPLARALPPTPTLETERLVLRPLRADDIPDIQRIFPQWEVVRYLNAQIPWPYPDDGAATNVAQCLEKRAHGEQFYWVITLKGDDALRGRIDLWPDDGVRHDMRGFWLDPLLHGQGLMTEAAEAVTQFAFEVLGWPHLLLTNAAENAASRRVKEKQGAVHLGREPWPSVSGPGERDLWRLTRESWLARRNR